jgi:hypothetical protein
MKSWTHPETETVHSYIGAVISMVILLLTVDHWTFDVVAFPLFVACIGLRGVVSSASSSAHGFGASVIRDAGGAGSAARRKE